MVANLERGGRLLAGLRASAPAEGVVAKVTSLTGETPQFRDLSRNLPCLELDFVGPQIRKAKANSGIGTPLGRGSGPDLGWRCLGETTEEKAGDVESICPGFRNMACFGAPWFTEDRGRFLFDAHFTPLAVTDLQQGCSFGNSSLRRSGRAQRNGRRERKEEGKPSFLLERLWKAADLPLKSRSRKAGSLTGAAHEGAKGRAKPKSPREDRGTGKLYRQEEGTP